MSVVGVLLGDDDVGCCGRVGRDALDPGPVVACLFFEEIGWR